MPPRIPLARPFPPMEARVAERLPTGEVWQYEPKWDGFRCIVFRDGAEVELQSKAGKPLTRYFPEIVDAVKRVRASTFVLDGELLIVTGAVSDFDALLQRVHPADSRVKRLAGETPATLLAFDLLVDPGGQSRVGQALTDRRSALEAFAGEFIDGNVMQLSPATLELAQAQRWLDHGGDLFDGVMAKRLDAAYDSGGRDAAVKIKHSYTADCVVGGYRMADGDAVASLLLGLFDGDTLDQVGFLSGLSAAARREAYRLLKPLTGGSGFTGVLPGGPSRWRSGEHEWTPVDPTLVVEVGFDRVTGRRFRHGAKFIRWRPDKSPKQCTIDQLDRRRPRDVERTGR